MSDDLQELNELLQRIRAGSQDAVRELLERYGRHIMHVIRRRLDRKLRSKFAASDFYQDVWASFLCNPTATRTFNSAEDFFAYLTAMARNKVSEAARQRFASQKHNLTREHSLDGSFGWVAEDTPDRGPSPSETVACEEEWELLLEGKPDCHQRILTMLRQGYTHAEIARTLDVSEKTVQRLIQRLSTEFGS